jgi:LPS sulfotransferase NodH
MSGGGAGPSVWRSVLLCSVQRSGTWLLAHALEDTRVLGEPAEYFHRGDEAFWRGQWDLRQGDAEDAFLRCVQTRPVTANGVWSSKMMWNYFPEALARLRAWPRLRVDTSASDADVLDATFPGLRYVWLRREDTLRQAISWWRADVTGQYALDGSEPVTPAPPFDRGAIKALRDFADKCHAGWRDWFRAHGITPLELTYETMAGDLVGTIRQVADFSDVELPAAVTVTPRLTQQADDLTEQLVERFNQTGER